MRTKLPFRFGLIRLATLFFLAIRLTEGVGRASVPIKTAWMTPIVSNEKKDLLLNSYIHAVGRCNNANLLCSMRRHQRTSRLCMR